MDYEVVIGLEVHTQLRTESKLFSPAPVSYGEEPNHSVHPVCLALPGVLPVLNGQAVELAGDKSVSFKRGELTIHVDSDLLLPEPLTDAMGNPMTAGDPREGLLVPRFWFAPAEFHKPIYDGLNFTPATPHCLFGCHYDYWHSGCSAYTDCILDHHRQPCDCTLHGCPSSLAARSCLGPNFAR